MSRLNFKVSRRSGNDCDGGVTVRLRIRSSTPLRVAVLTLFLILASSPATFAGASGSISGAVVDPQGAVVPNASVALINTATGLRYVQQTDAIGIYLFRDVPVGQYELRVDASGFRVYQRSPIAVDANSALLIDITLALGVQTSAVTVTQSPVTVQTADTQLGEVIGTSSINAIPLNGRSFTDLLALQPGVAPMTTITGTSIQAAGASIFAPSGYLNPGTISINGQREYANGFTVNDADVVERFTMGGQSFRIWHSIDEFRVLDGKFRCGIRKLQWRPHQYRDAIRQQRLAWECVRISAEHRLRRAKLFCVHARGLPAESIRWIAWRPHHQKQSIFLRGLPGHSSETGH